MAEGSWVSWVDGFSLRSSRRWWWSEMCLFRRWNMLKSPSSNVRPQNVRFEALQTRVHGSCFCRAWENAVNSCIFLKSLFGHETLDSMKFLWIPHAHCSKMCEANWRVWCTWLTMQVRVHWISLILGLFHQFNQKYNQRIRLIEYTQCFIATFELHLPWQA